MSATNRPAWEQPLDSSLYNPNEEEKAFMKTTTGIEDEEELKAHIIGVQTKAYRLYKYPCIRLFGFMAHKIVYTPTYKQFIELGKQREGAIFLDMGCCFGTDIRKAVLDGWPVKGAIAADLIKDFWDLGHELFRSTPEMFPVPFLQGDVLDPAILTQAPVLPTSSSTPPVADIPPLSEVASLNQLHGKLSAIFTGAFFHLFKFDVQEQVARRLAGLLSPLPGSVIFGLHVGQPVKREYFFQDGTGTMDCHSPESWRELWEGVFAEVGANVEVKANDVRRRPDGELLAQSDNTDLPYMLEWSVTRV